jgi:EmrB/QacA subfamily drug resistance transporter
MELSRQQKVFTFVGTLLGLFLGALDQTVVATAGPAIQKDLAIPAGLYAWLTTSYTLASTVFVPVWAKLSDLYGRRRIIVSGITLFLLASVLCGLCQTTAQLIVCRGLQGLGGASLFTTAFAVVADMFSPAERGKYSGIFGGVFGLASLIGPVLGGFITHQFGWHWVFFINLPVGAAALFFILTRMPPLKRELKVAPKVDFVGAVLLASGVVPILIALSFGRGRDVEGWGWTSWQSLSLFGGGALMLVVFALFERTREQPLIDLSLFRNRVFAVGNACVFVLGGVFLSPMIYLPLFVTRVVGVSATKAGLSLMPLVLGVIAGNVTSGQVTARLGRYKGPMLVGLCMLLIGLSVMSFTLRPDIGLGELTAKMLLVGIGLGPAIPLYTIAIQNAIPPDVMGSATGVATFFRQMGGTLGIAVAGTLFAMAVGGAAPVPGESLLSARRPPDVETQKAHVRTQVIEARALGVRALHGDAQAAAMLSQGPFADKALKVLMVGGGPLARARRVEEAQWARVQAAAASPQSWEALSRAEDLPPELRAALAQSPPDLARARAALEEARTRIERLDVSQSGDQLEALLTKAQEQALRHIDDAAAALKDAYTQGLRTVYRFALALAVLALLLTLMLPSLPLRKTAPAVSASS